MAQPRRSLLHEADVLAARLLVGGALLVGGVVTLLAPAAEFEATIGRYALLPPQMGKWVAQGLPWVEAVIGLAVIVGLSQRITLRIAASLVTTYWLVISQALLRQLPLTECGCFGALISFSPQQMWLVDAILASLAWWLVFRHTPTLTVDRRLS